MKSPHKRVVAGLLTLGLAVFWPLAARADTGPIGSVGPTETVGPTALVGPATAPGPTGPVGPTSQSNNVTGPSSDNQNQTTSSSQTQATANQSATVNNNLAASADTGGNSVSRNTQAGNVQSGSIQGSATIVNAANTNLAPGSTAGVATVSGSSGSGLVLSTPSSQVPIGQSNNVTGPNSANQNAAQGSTVATVLTNQDAAINNTVDIQASTGKNQLTGNSRVGGLQTGNIGLGVNLLNIANLNRPDLQLEVNTWTIQGAVGGDITVPTNSGTDPGSLNVNTANSNNQTQVAVTQTAAADNVINVKANTGENAVNGNTAAGDTQTGQANVDNKTITVANTSDPTFYLVNVFGQWDGMAGLNNVPAGNYIVNVVGNNLTGPDSSNSNSVSDTQTASTTINQRARVNNLVNVTADTGHNTVTNNTQAGRVATGSINIAANTINLLNLIGQKAGHFVLGIINIFGNWAKTPPPAAPTTQTATVVQIENRHPEEVPAGTSEGPRSDSGNLTGQGGGAVAKPIETARRSVPSGVGGETAAVVSSPSVPAPITLASLPKTGVNNPVTVGYSMLVAALSAYTGLISFAAYRNYRRFHPTL